MTNEIEKTMDRTIRMAAEFRQNLKEEYDKLIYKEVNNVD